MAPGQARMCDHHMKDIVIKAREMMVVSPNERYSMPDHIADQLIARGKAELIPQDIIEQEKPRKKGTK